MCDGVQDCAQGEDENGCIVTCDADTQFACNAVNDSSPVTSSRSARTLPSHTARSSVPCIHKKHVCDGKSDCPRGEGKAIAISTLQHIHSVISWNYVYNVVYCVCDTFVVDRTEI